MVHGKVMPAPWWEEVSARRMRYNVSPFFAAAVMHMEGNGWAEQRLGHSPYWGPMGVNEYCRVSADAVTDPLCNIRVGVAALQGKEPQTVLKRYNSLWFKDHYIRDVLALARQLEREARMEVGLSDEVKGRGSFHRRG